MATTYAYKVRDSTGTLKKGTLEGDNPAQVATKLRTMGLAPVSISEANAGLNREITIPGFSGKKVGLKDLKESLRSSLARLALR